MRHKNPHSASSSFHYICCEIPLTMENHKTWLHKSQGLSPVKSILETIPRFLLWYPLGVPPELRCYASRSRSACSSGSRAPAGKLPGSLAPATPPTRPVPDILTNQSITTLNIFKIIKSNVLSIQYIAGLLTVFSLLR